MRRTCVYAASLDPITNGHLWLIGKGLSLFDHLIVAIGVNPAKRPAFDIDLRLDLVRRSLAEAGITGSVEVDQFSGRYLVRYAESKGAGFLLRGIRTEADYGYERTLRHVNSDMKPEIESVFLMPPRELAEVSSSFVRDMVGPEGWEAAVSRYVTPCVLDALRAKAQGAGGGA